jgi:hypothetical protein
MSVYCRLEVAAQMVWFWFCCDRRVVDGGCICDGFVRVNATTTCVAVIARARRGTRRDVSNLDGCSTIYGCCVVDVLIGRRHKLHRRRYLGSGDGSTASLTGCSTDIHWQTDLHLRLVAPDAEPTTERHGCGAQRSEGSRR